MAQAPGNGVVLDGCAVTTGAGTVKTARTSARNPMGVVRSGTPRSKGVEAPGFTVKLVDLITWPLASRNAARTVQAATGVGDTTSCRFKTFSRTVSPGVNPTIANVAEYGGAGTEVDVPD
jgi:hypothetical protein